MGTLVDASAWGNLVPLEQGGYITRLKPSEIEPDNSPLETAEVQAESEAVVAAEEPAEKPVKSTPAKKKAAVKKASQK